MRRLFGRFLTDQRGATAIEYGLIMALIFLVLVSAFSLFAGGSTGVFNKAMNAISAAINGA